MRRYQMHHPDGGLSMSLQDHVQVLVPTNGHHFGNPVAKNVINQASRGNSPIYSTDCKLLFVVTVYSCNHNKQASCTSFLMLCLLLVRVATAAALTSQSDTITVPHLSGIFVSLDNVTSARTVAGWTEDLTAMKAIGIEFLVLRAVAQGCSPPQCAPTSSACPLGGFRAVFPTKGAGQPACFVEEHVGIDTVENVFAAAEAVGLGVHLGLAYPVTSSIAKSGLNSTAYFRYLASVNWDLAQELWGRYVVGKGHKIAGFYTDVEESNSIGELALMNALVGHYLEPVARDIKQRLSPDTLVWASPYYVGNLTRHPARSWMGPRFYADWWGQVLILIDNLFIKLQPYGELLGFCA